MRGRDKMFWQEHWDGDEWIKGLSYKDEDGNVKQVRRVLYNLQQVTAVADRGGVVWMVEGEKDADRLTADGDVTATTTPGGADNFDADLLAPLYGVRKLIICPDNDEAGHKHARAIMRACKRHGIQYQFALIPHEWNLGDHADISDVLDSGYELGDIPRTAKPPGKPLSDEPDSEPVGVVGEFDLSDTPPVFQLALERANMLAAEQGRPRATFDRSTWEQKGRVQYRVSCPVHDDHRASFAISTGDDQPLLVNCRKAGCGDEDDFRDKVAKALGIRVQDFSEYHPPDAEEADVLREVHKIRVRRRAQIVINSEESIPLVLPPGDPSEYLEKPPPEHLFSVEDLHVHGSNTLVVAQYKTGKTTLCINLMRSLVNSDPFLGRFDVWAPEGKVAYLDYEMQASQFRTWLQAGGTLDRSRFTTPVHLRGVKFPFWVAARRVEFVQWLLDHNVTTLIIDTGMRASDGLVDNWNDNNQMMAFTASLDELKSETDVDNLFVVTHTGRDSAFAEEGQEHARGATRLEDWMDGGWYYTKDSTGTRYMRAIGRGVDMEPFAVEYDASAHKLMTSGISKAEFQIHKGLEVVADALFAAGEMSPAEMKAMLEREKIKHSVIGEATTRGYIESIQEGRKTVYKLTDVGVKLHHRRITTKQEDQKDD